MNQAPARESGSPGKRSNRTDQISYPPAHHLLAETQSRAFSTADTVCATKTPPMNPWPKARRIQQLEEALAPEALLHFDILMALPFPVIALDPEGRVQFWNPAATREFGWTHVDVMGEAPPIIPTDRWHEHAIMLDQARVSGATPEIDTLRRRKDGQYLRVQASAQLHTGLGVVLSFRTPNPAWRNQQEAFPQPGDASQLELMGRLLGAVAHDVNNVLAVVSGHSEWLLELLPRDSIAHESVQAIRQASQHAVSLTRQLLGLGQPCSAVPVPVDVGQVVLGMGSLIRAIAGTSTKVLIRPGTGHDAVLAIPTQIEQIVLNLISNAREAMPRGGTLGLRVQRMAKERVAARLRDANPSGPLLCLTVADSGIGMTPQQLQTIFEPHVSTKTAPGHGLGLSTVREIVASLRGWISVDSRPGWGSVFRIYLPIWNPQPQCEASADQPLRESQPWQPRGTVLLVEEDPVTREQQRAIIEQAGYEVIETTSGEMALKLCRAIPQRIDVLVTDLVMPGLSGRRLVTQMRQTRPGIGVVYVSAYPPSRAEYNAVYVAKPFRPHELLNGIDSILPVYLS